MFISPQFSLSLGPISIMIRCVITVISYLIVSCLLKYLVFESHSGSPLLFLVHTSVGNLVSFVAKFSDFPTPFETFF